jgi:hypothetical protein
VAQRTYKSNDLLIANISDTVYISDTISDTVDIADIVYIFKTAHISDTVSISDTLSDIVHISDIFRVIACVLSFEFDQEQSSDFINEVDCKRLQTIRPTAFDNNCDLCQICVKMNLVDERM